MAWELPEPETEGERLLVAATAAGEAAMLAELPEGQQRVVRAALIRCLLFGGTGGGRITDLGLRLHNAVVEGALDLDGLGHPQRMAPPLTLAECTSWEAGGIPVSLTNAAIAGLDLSRSELAMLAARGLVCGRGVDLLGTTVVPDGGEVMLDEARIDGLCWFNGLTGMPGAPAGPVLNLANARIGGMLRLEGAELQALVMPAAQIRGDLGLHQSRITPEPGQDAIHADRLKLEGALFLSASWLRGVVRLGAAEIAGDLSLRNGTQLEGTRGVALTAEEARIVGGLEVSGGCRVSGSLRLRAARLGAGVVVSGGSRVVARGGASLNLEEAQVGGGLSIGDCALVGELNLNSATIGSGVVIASEAELMAQGGYVLDAENARIGSSLVMREVTLRGRVTLAGLAIGGDLLMEDATLVAAQQDRIALFGLGLSVARDAQLADPRGRFAADITGQVLLDRASIAGNLELGGLLLRPAPDAGDDDLVLSLKDARIGAALRVAALPAATQGTVDLTGAHAGVLEDNDGMGWGPPGLSPEAVAPTADRQGERLDGVLLKLEGFTYDRLPDVDERDAETNQKRLNFLRRQFPGGTPRRHHYAPQPFEQVSRALRASGNPQEAEWFALQKQYFRRECQVDTGWFGFFNWFSGTFFDHFYSPGRALQTLLLFVLLGAGGLLAANDVGALREHRVKVDPAPAVARAEAVPACWPDAGERRIILAGMDLPVPHHVVVLDAMMMALDLALPLVELKQDDRCEIGEEHPNHSWWQVAMTLYSVLGLVILPMFLATVTGLLRRD